MSPTTNAILGAVQFAMELASTCSPTARRYSIPLWRYGFEWNPDKALELARTCKARGSEVRPPLQDKWDLARDLGDEQLSSRRYRAELGRGADIYAWGMLFLHYQTEVPRIGEGPTPVHTGRTGAGADIVSDIILVGSAWKAEDLIIESLRDAGRLVIAEESVDVLRAYLGEPQWFLDWEYAEKNKFLESLESGAFQSLVGIPVPDSDSVSFRLTSTSTN